MKNFSLCLLIFLAACQSTQAAQQSPISIDYTPAAQPWLSVLYDCAAEIPLTLEIEELPAGFLDYNADLTLRLGEPEVIGGIAYEIGMDEIVIVTSPQNPVPTLSLQEIQLLFMGRIQDWSEVGNEQAAIQVWMYNMEEDIQQFFNAVVMEGQPISSLARLATSPGQLRTEVSTEPTAIGWLPKSWVDETIHVLQLPTELKAALKLPVLAITREQPEGALNALLTCAQR